MNSYFVCFNFRFSECQRSLHCLSIIFFLCCLWYFFLFWVRLLFSIQSLLCKVIVLFVFVLLHKKIYSCCDCLLASIYDISLIFLHDRWQCICRTWNFNLEETCLLFTVVYAQYNMNNVLGIVSILKLSFLLMCHILSCVKFHWKIKFILICENCLNFIH